MIKKITEKDSVLIFLFILVIYFLLSSGHFGGDSIYVYLTAESVFTDGNFNLADSLKEKNIGKLTKPFETITNNIRELSKKYDKVYAKFGLGSILISIIFYGIGLIFTKILPFFPKDFLLIFSYSLQNIFVLSLATVVFYKIVFHFSKRKKLSLLLALGFAFGSMNITYALKSGLGEPLAELAILSGFYFLLLFNEHRKIHYLFFAGLFVGSFIITKPYTVVLYPAFFIFLYLIIIDKKIKNLLRTFAVFGFGFIIPVLSFMIFNFIRFGSITQIGYTATTEQSLVSQQMVIHPFYFFITLFNILLSPGKGILFFNPLILFSLFGIKTIFREYKKLFFFFIIGISFYFIFFSFSSHWASNGAWGPRYFVPLVGILLIPSAFVFKNLDKVKFTKYNKILIILLVLGMLIQLPSVLMNFSAYERFLEKECSHSYYTRITLPQYSQIIGGYYQLASGFSRILTGNSMKFPMILAEHDDIRKIKKEKNDHLLYLRGIIVWKSLAGYDWFDLWWIHFIQADFPGTFIKIIFTLVILFLIFLSYTTGKKLFSGKKPED